MALEARITWPVIGSSSRQVRHLVAGQDPGDGPGRDPELGTDPVRTAPLPVGAAPRSAARPRAWSGSASCAAATDRVVQPGLALGGVPVQPGLHTLAGDPHRRRDVGLRPAGPMTLHDQQPAKNGGAGITSLSVTVATPGVDLRGQSLRTPGPTASAYPRPRSPESSPATAVRRWPGPTRPPGFGSVAGQRHGATNGPRQATWSTWTSRSSVGSLTAAATEQSVDRPAGRTQANAEPATGTSTPPSTTTPAWAYSELHHDERKETAAGFWTRANAYFESVGITVQRVLTDNGSCYRSQVFAAALGDAITHKRTRPYRPQTNGKVERLNRTMLEEWAYARPYRSETERVASFDQWLHTYNHHRGHTALDGLSPADLVPNLRGQNT